MLAGVLKDEVLAGVQVAVEAGVGARVYPGLDLMFLLCCVSGWYAV